MAKFRKDASPEKQALSVAKTLHRGGHIQSIRTLTNYQERLTLVARNMNRFGLSGEIRGLTAGSITHYLAQRAAEVGQKTLDMERQALQAMARHVTREITPEATLTVVKSHTAQRLTGRAYSPEQVVLVAGHQSAQHGLATEVAHAAGLRAHELYSLRPAHEQPGDKRPAAETKWHAREGERYTVQGKGGLVREVLIPVALANRLETVRLSEPVSETDRGVYYQKYYAIGAGQKWSNSFSAASQRALGWSEGAHGVRHSYAQERMNELQNHGIPRERALETVSQEMGHFRPDITETYLR